MLFEIVDYQLMGQVMYVVLMMNETFFFLDLQLSNYQWNQNKISDQNMICYSMMLFDHIVFMYIYVKVK